MKKLRKRKIIKESRNKDCDEKQSITPSEFHDMMDAMNDYLDKQEDPKIGIFWYSPKILDVFGVVAVDAYQQAEIQKGNIVICKERHKYEWEKQENFFKKLGGSDLFVGDYKYTPRGSIIYFPQLNEYHILVGSWIKEHPGAIERIKDAFDLNDEKLNVIVKICPLLEIGVDYEDLNQIQ